MTPQLLTRRAFHRTALASTACLLAPGCAAGIPWLCIVRITLITARLAGRETVKQAVSLALRNAFSLASGSIISPQKLMNLDMSSLFKLSEAAKPDAAEEKVKVVSVEGQNPQGQPVALTDPNLTPQGQGPTVKLVDADGAELTDSLAVVAEQQHAGNPGFKLYKKAMFKFEYKCPAVHTTRTSPQEARQLAACLNFLRINWQGRDQADGSSIVKYGATNVWQSAVLTGEQVTYWTTELQKGGLEVKSTAI